MSNLKNNFYFKAFIRALKECKVYNSKYINLETLVNVINNEHEPFYPHVLASSVNLLTHKAIKVQKCYINIIKSKYVEDIYKMLIENCEYNKKTISKIDILYEINKNYLYAYCRRYGIHNEKLCKLKFKYIYNDDNT